MLDGSQEQGRGVACRGGKLSQSALYRWLPQPRWHRQDRPGSLISMIGEEKDGRSVLFLPDHAVTSSRAGFGQPFKYAAS
jgi:hypothetical protein